MTYVKIAMAAIQRHRLEKPYRELVKNHLPKRKRNAPFGVLMMMLCQKGYITKQDRKHAIKEYTRLSKVIHAL